MGTWYQIVATRAVVYGQQCGASNVSTTWTKATSFVATAPAFSITNTVSIGPFNGLKRVANGYAVGKTDTTTSNPTGRFQARVACCGSCVCGDADSPQPYEVRCVVWSNDFDTTDSRD